MPNYIYMCMCVCLRVCAVVVYIFYDCCFSSFLNTSLKGQMLKIVAFGTMGSQTSTHPIPIWAFLAIEQTTRRWPSLFADMPCCDHGTPFKLRLLLQSHQFSFCFPYFPQIVIRIHHFQRKMPCEGEPPFLDAVAHLKSPFRSITFQALTTEPCCRMHTSRKLSRVRALG